MRKYFATPLNFLYLMLMIILVFTYTTIDLNTYYDSSVIKFSAVIVVNVYVFIIGMKYIIKKENIIINILYIVAITFTLISDYFLLVINDYFNAGLTTFIVAQLSYSFIICFLDVKKSKKSLIIEKTLIIILGLIGLILSKEVFVFLAIVYGLNLISNFVSSLVLFARTKRNDALFLMIGFLLFIGCDTCVFLSNLYLIYNDTKAIEDIQNFAINIVWIFYGPSQYFLGLSINRGKKDEKESIES